MPITLAVVGAGRVRLLRWLVLSSSLNAALTAAVLVLVKRLGWQVIALRLRERRHGPSFYQDIAHAMFGTQLIPAGGVALVGDSQIQFAPLLELLTPFRVRGIGGSLAADLLTWIDPVLDQPVDRIVIMTGTNDARRGVPVADTIAAIGQILSRITERRPGCAVTIVSVPPMPKVRAAVDALNGELQALATDRGHGWADLTPDLDAMAWTRDGVHLNADAYRRVAPLIRTAAGVR
jgi:hypothetical protein